MSIKNIKRIITAWKPSTFETYKKTFEKYGGSVNMHPDVVSYFMIHHDWKFDFFHYEKDGDIKGSYFLCNGKQIGIMARRSYPLSSDEVLIPFSCLLYLSVVVVVLCGVVLDVGRIFKKKKG
ncbi:hypothetical protein ABUT94_00610, partial [Escherichia coli]